MQISKLWECEATDAQKLLSQWEKVTKCNFKSKDSSTWKMFLSNEMNIFYFLQCRDRFSWVWAFLQKKHLELSMHKITSLASKNTNSVILVQISKLWECEATDAQNIFLSEKKLLNAILRAKLKHMKNVSCLSNEMKSFLQCRRRFSCVWAFLQKKFF